MQNTGHSDRGHRDRPSCHTALDNELERILWSFVAGQKWNEIMVYKKMIMKSGYTAQGSGRVRVSQAISERYGKKEKDWEKIMMINNSLSINMWSNWLITYNKRGTIRPKTIWKFNQLSKNYLFLEANYILHSFLNQLLSTDVTSCFTMVSLLSVAVGAECVFEVLFYLQPPPLNVPSWLVFCASAHLKRNFRY